MKLKFNISHLDAIIDQDFGDEFFKKYIISPDVSHINSLQRRRLSICSKSILHLLKNYNYKIPMVFSSAYAEINRCFSLLGDIGAKEAISPTSFSLSVHNANLGLSSILNENHEEISAICNELSLEYAILNGYLRLQDGHQKVGIIIYNESIDNKFLKLPSPNYTIFMVIEKGDKFSLEKKFSDKPCKDSIDPSILALRSFKNIANHTKSWKNSIDRSIWEYRYEYF